MKISGSTFIVTGGSSGLGEATVRRLHGAGARVLVCDLDVARGEALVNELGEGAQFAKSDVATEADGRAAIQSARKAFKSIDGLVNCAGIATGERVLSKNGPHRLESFARCVQINLVGTFNMLRLAAEVMAAQEAKADGERGVIVNTASVAAYDGQIGQAAYSASKAGIVGMTLPIARDLAKSGIRVVTIAPGLFMTPMMKGHPLEVQQSLGQQTPFPSRLGEPDEFAALVQHIAENVLLNGETIRLDGAIRMAPR
jgi:NAD(P)-dependent dehydrogenase (short-subunit alcohol dehydrogenase family)